MEFHGIPWFHYSCYPCFLHAFNVIVFPMLAWKSMESTPCFPWNFAPMEFHGIFPMLFHGIPWNSMVSLPMLSMLSPCFQCNRFPHASMEKHGKYPWNFAPMEFMDFHGIFPMLFPWNSMVFPCFFYQGRQRRASIMDMTTLNKNGQDTFTADEILSHGGNIQQMEAAK